VKQLTESFGSAEQLVDGAVGRLPLERIDIVTREELDRRAQWDDEHTREVKAEESEWKDEQQRRQKVKEEIEKLELRWEEARGRVHRVHASKQEEVDAMDEARLATWEAELVRLSDMTDTAYTSARVAWSQFAEETRANYETTGSHMAAAQRYLDDERKELERRSDTLTANNNATGAKLAELHAGLEECVRAFHGSRQRQEKALDADRDECRRILEAGLEAQRQREQELDQRERDLEARRAAMEAYHEKRENVLTRKAAEQQRDAQQREEALEALRVALQTSMQLRQDELDSRDRDQAAREEQLMFRHETALNDLAAKEEEVKLKQAAFETHAVNLREALAEEIRAVDARVKTSETACKAAREVAEQRILEAKRAQADAEATLKERSAALDRRQAEMERRQRVTAIAEERAQQALENRTQEVLKRAHEDRRAVADIQANLSSQRGQLEADQQALEKRRKDLEARMQQREAAAASSIAAVRAHCKAEFDEALQVMKETDAVEGVHDFKGLTYRDMENLWSTMTAFRKVKSRFVETVTRLEEADQAQLEAEQAAH
jgi:hypothetical protein